MPFSLLQQLLPWQFGQTLLSPLLPHLFLLLELQSLLGFLFELCLDGALSDHPLGDLDCRLDIPCVCTILAWSLVLHMLLGGFYLCSRLHVQMLLDDA